ncbi:hypothetical protein BJF77_12520 [Kocuria sp. CNJ-770]|nr:hypothetical protein BJF77_12520 [Kocuria sp. CNJ-770]
MGAALRRAGAGVLADGPTCRGDPPDRHPLLVTDPLQRPRTARTRTEIRSCVTGASPAGPVDVTDR